MSLFTSRIIIRIYVTHRYTAQLSFYMSLVRWKFWQYSVKGSSAEILNHSTPLLNPLNSWYIWVDCNFDMSIKSNYMCSNIKTFGTSVYTDVKRWSKICILTKYKIVVKMIRFHLWNWKGLNTVGMMKLS